MAHNVPILARRGRTSFFRDAGAKQSRLTEEQKLNIRTRVRGGNLKCIGQFETVKLEVLRDQERAAMRVQG